MAEDNQENFLVLKGSCTLLIEEQTHVIKEWDFVHCPQWAQHVFYNHTHEPCLLLMAGSRAGKNVIYPSNDFLKKYDACPQRETDCPKESYEGCADFIKARSPLKKLKNKLKNS